MGHPGGANKPHTMGGPMGTMGAMGTTGTASMGTVNNKAVAMPQRKGSGIGTSVKAVLYTFTMT